MTRVLAFLACAVLACGLATDVAAQTPARPPGTPVSAPAAVAAPAAPVVPPGFVIGAEDVLSIVFWREKDMSTDVVVRPDGRISLPLLNDVQAAGLTPDQLREKLQQAAAEYLEDPNPTVVVKQINSRRVFITGNIAKQGSYNLAGPTSVIQLISMAGGLLEYADKDHIVVLHAEKRPDGQPTSHQVNYSEVMKRKNLRQNIELKPGDTVIVP